MCKRKTRPEIKDIIFNFFYPSEQKLLNAPFNFFRGELTMTYEDEPCFPVSIDASQWCLQRQARPLHGNTHCCLYSPGSLSVQTHHTLPLQNCVSLQIDTSQWCLQNRGLPLHRRITVVPLEASSPSAWIYTLAPLQSRFSLCADAS